MNCREVQIHLSAWVDGNLEAELEGSVRSHLSSCDRCGRFLQEIRGLNRLVQNVPPELDPPERIWRRIEARLETGVSRPTPVPPSIFDWRDRLSLPALRFALPALVLLIGLSVYFLYDSENLERKEKAQVLAELNQFQLQVEGNPFQRAVSTSNPFFRVDLEAERNPFEGRSAEQ